jgi:DNA-binding response OmpR family regulator
MRVLLIEDDSAVVHFLAKGFMEEGWEVQTALDGREGLSLAMGSPFDVIVLDILLPGLHGLEVLRRIREEGISSPVVILTALDEKEDVVRGLDLGADDYLVKPFFFTELIARVRAILRRSQSPLPAVLKVADLTLDPARRRVERGGKSIELTAKEFSLLEYFMRHPGQILTRVMILESVFDYHFDSMTNLVDVHVYKLRNKVDRGFSRALIRTVKGVGYVLEP